MIQNNFIMKTNTARSVGRIFGALISLMLLVWAVIFLLFIGASETGELIFGIFIIVFAPFVAVFMLNSAFWKCTIQGDHITVRTLFVTTKFTFDAIKKVELEVVSTNRYGDLKTLLIFLRDRSERRPISIPHKTIGRDTFIDCLKSRDILGVENL